jgi:DNA-binding MarR family transcriptional regulator
MEEAGYVARTQHESDRRVNYATITKKGRREFSSAAPVAFAGVQKHFTSQLTQGELRALESALVKVLRASREAVARRAV